MEPSESALRVLSTMFDTQDGDDATPFGAHTISATRPAEDCGCQHAPEKRLLKPRQF